MKLKKIASLALAGIMAVSMLAGCKDASSTPTDPETPTTPVSGVAATVNSELKFNGDQIAFSDNADMQNLLEAYFANHEFKLTDAQTTNVTVQYKRTGNASAIANDLAENIMNVLGDGNWKDEFAHSSDGVLLDTNDKEKTGVEVYLLSGKLSESEALKLVGNYIDNLDMPTENNAKTKDYSYAGGIAAVKAESKGKTESAWIIAATITQTPSDK